jgi:hypothetical protein
LKKLNSICLIETFVFRFFESCVVTFDVSQFCTGVNCRRPHREPNIMSTKRKKDILCFVFLNIRLHAKAHPINKITKKRVEAGKTKKYKAASTNQNSSASEIHFNMFKNLRRVNY